MYYTVFMEDADGDEIWLTRFDSHGQANALMNNLIQGGIKAWVEENLYDHYHWNG